MCEDSWWFDKEKPGWYETTKICRSTSKYEDMVKWIVDTLDKPYRHCRWHQELNESLFLQIRVRFRYERDYILFTLRWL